MVLKRISNHVPAETRMEVYKYLMREGTLVLKYDKTIAEHQDLKIPNLYAILIMQRLESKKYVTCTYNWGYKYYVLTSEGIEFLSQTLALPPTVLPSTYIAPSRVAAREVTA